MTITGWSKVTVTSNFSLASLKITKNVKTQPFLESLYATILIFQCLSRVRWQKLCLSGLCLNSAFAPYCRDWESLYPPITSEGLKFPWILLRYPPNTPQTSPDIFREHDMPTGDNRYQGTLPDILKQHLSLSWGVCWCLLASVGVCWHIVFTVDAMGLSGECLGGVWGISEWYS